MSIYIQNNAITNLHQVNFLDKVSNESDKKTNTVFFIDNISVEDGYVEDYIKNSIEKEFSIDNKESQKKLIDNVINFIKNQKEKSTINTILEERISIGKFTDTPRLPDDVLMGLTIKDNEIVINTLVKINEYSSDTKLIKAPVGENFAEIDGQCILNNKGELVSSALVVTYAGSGVNFKSALDVRDLFSKWLQQIAHFLGIIDINDKIEKIKCHRPNEYIEAAKFEANETSNIVFKKHNNFWGGMSSDVNDIIENIKDMPKDEVKNSNLDDLVGCLEVTREEEGINNELEWDGWQEETDPELEWDGMNEWTEHWKAGMDRQGDNITPIK